MSKKSIFIIVCALVLLIATISTFLVLNSSDDSKSVQTSKSIPAELLKDTVAFKANLKAKVRKESESDETLSNIEVSKNVEDGLNMRSIFQTSENLLIFTPKFYQGRLIASSNNGTTTAREYDFSKTKPSENSSESDVREKLYSPDRKHAIVYDGTNQYVVKDEQAGDPIELDPYLGSYSMNIAQTEVLGFGVASFYWVSNDSFYYVVTQGSKNLLYKVIIENQSLTQSVIPFEQAGSIVDVLVYQGKQYGLLLTIKTKGKYYEATRIFSVINLETEEVLYSSEPLKLDCNIKAFADENGGTSCATPIVVFGKTPYQIYGTAETFKAKPLQAFIYDQNRKKFYYPDAALVLPRFSKE